jgi:hypothetical protein
MWKSGASRAVNHYRATKIPRSMNCARRFLRRAAQRMRTTTIDKAF